MNVIFVAIIVCLLVVAASGCTSPAQPQTNSITNQEDAQQTVGEVSQDASDLAAALNDVDAQLG